MFSTNFLSEFVYCILNCYAHMNILQMEYAHYKCKLLLFIIIIIIYRPFTSPRCTHDIHVIRKFRGNYPCVPFQVCLFISPIAQEAIKTLLVCQ